jgi:flagellar motor switch/type III secretory pathway protein FliN
VELKFLADLPRVARGHVDELGAIARWVGAARGGEQARVAALVGAPVRVRDVVIAPGRERDRFAARCDVRIDGGTVAVSAPSAFVRVVARRLVGGPEELAAPRPATIAERAIWTLVVAAALVDLDVAGQAWLALDDDEVPDACDAVCVAIELDVGAAPVTVWLDVPRAIARRAPEPHAPRRAAAWTERVELDIVVAVARCAVDAAAAFALEVGDVVTTERVPGGLELVVGDGAVAVAAATGAVVATVASEYVPRDMAIGDAELELVVALGTTRLSLRRLAALAVGEVVPLGRPLAGPFELRAAGRVVGRGELVDVDGELGVRVVSLGDSP